MTGEFTGKVAFITGAAHGQGRATALAFAREGARIAGFDIARPLELSRVHDGVERRSSTH